MMHRMKPTNIRLDGPSYQRLKELAEVTQLTQLAVLRVLLNNATPRSILDTIASSVSE